MIQLVRSFKRHQNIMTLEPIFCDSMYVDSFTCHDQSLYYLRTFLRVYIPLIISYTLLTWYPITNLYVNCLTSFPWESPNLNCLRKWHTIIVLEKKAQTFWLSIIKRGMDSRYGKAQFQCLPQYAFMIWGSWNYYENEVLKCSSVTNNSTPFAGLVFNHIKPLFFLPSS